MAGPNNVNYTINGDRLSVDPKVAETIKAIASSMVKDQDMMRPVAVRAEIAQKEMELMRVISNIKNGIKVEPEAAAALADGLKQAGIKLDIKPDGTVGYEARTPTAPQAAPPQTAPPQAPPQVAPVQATVTVQAAAPVQPATPAAATPDRSFQERTGIKDPAEYAALMERQMEWERAGTEGGLRTRVSPVDIAIRDERNRIAAAQQPVAPVAVAVAAVAPATPTQPVGLVQPDNRSLQERTGISDPAQYAALMERQMEWDRAGTEGGMRARTSPVEAAMRDERNRIATIQQGVPTGTVTLGDGTVATIKNEAPAVAQPVKPAAAVAQAPTEGRFSQSDPGIYERARAQLQQNQTQQLAAAIPTAPAAVAPLQPVGVAPVVATVIPQVATVGPAVRNPLQDQLGMDDQKFASLMQRQQEWERAGVEGGMRSRTDPVMAAFQEQRAAQVAANPPAVAAVQVAVAPVTPSAPAGPTEPPKPLREQLGHMDDTQYAALMQRQQEWERAGVEGGMRSRTDPVMAAVQERRATEVAALAGIQTFSTTAGDGTVITAKQAPQTMGVNSDQMAFQAMMAKMLDNDNCVSMQGSGKMGCSALAQAGLGNAGVMVADPASGRESPVQTANAFLQKLVAGGGPEVQQQQIIKRPEMTIA